MDAGRTLGDQEQEVHRQQDSRLSTIVTQLPSGAAVVCWRLGPFSRISSRWRSLSWPRSGAVHFGDDMAQTGVAVVAPGRCRHSAVRRRLLVPREPELGPAVSEPGALTWNFRSRDANSKPRNSATGEPRGGEDKRDRQQRKTRRRPLPQPPVETLERSAERRAGVKSSLLRDDKVAGWNRRERFA